MPPVSQSQRAFFRWAAEHPKESGVSAKVSAEFNNSDPGGHLPEHVRPHRAFGGLSHGDPLGGLAKPHPVKMLATKGIGGAGGGGGGGGGGAHGMMSGSQQSPWWTRSEARNSDRPMHFDLGGSASFADENPWWERSSAINDMHMNAGMIPGSGGGRTDRVPLSVPVDSHVLTADTISGMGQNHTLNGWRNLLGSLRVGPYGVPDPTKIEGHGAPRAPSPPRGAIEEKRGGSAHDGGHDRVSILGASGEAVIPFHDWVARDPVDGKLYVHRGVRSLGLDWYAIHGGHPTEERIARKGHDVLDDLTKRVRAYNIAWLKNAPKPKRAEGGAVGLAAAA